MKITKIKKNIMGTTSFNAKFKGSRKEQEYIVYPISEVSSTITIQSDTRFGKIEIESGDVLLTKSHSNGANTAHFATDVLVEDTIENFEELKEFIRKTSGDFVGTSFLISDNSLAGEI